MLTHFNWCASFCWLWMLWGVEGTDQERIKYPATRRDDSVVDYYHGTLVKDPYRWLEDDNSPETKTFIEEQNTITSSFLEGILDRDRIRDKFREIWNFPKFVDAPIKAGDRYYFWKNSGLQNQGVIYVQDSLDGEATVFFDPNTLSPDGLISMRDYYFSKDGKIFSYCLSENGTDWKSCYFQDVMSGTKLKDKLEGLKFSSLQWTHDNLGVFYTSYPVDPSTRSRKLDNEKGWYHRLGTKQQEDILILEFPQKPNWNIGFEVTDCGKYLMAFPNTDFKANGLYLASLERGIHPFMFWMPIFTNITLANYEYVTNNGSLFYFQTDRNASRSQIIQVETEKLKNPRYAFTTLIPEHPKNVLYLSRAIAQNKLFLVYLEDMKHKIEVRKLVDGELFTKIPLEEMGSVWQVNTKVQDRQELFFLFESYVTAGRVYHCQFNDEDVNCNIFKETEIKQLNVSNIETHLVFYNSHDNTRIPMFLVHKKGLVRNGTSPVLLYGYGGFNSNNQPGFEIQNLIFIKYFDGIYAAPGLRGGGEYGEAWHAAGSLLNKKNVFNDFQAAAEYLIREKYTKPSKLVVLGSSNGGLLVGACVNQRPDLYGAAIAKVGVMDMIRFHKLGVGFWWTEEYGSSDTKEHFINLIRYSPLHNVQRYMLETIQYPAILILTGDHDDRVVPAHSYKYAAELQYRIGNLSQQMNPLLLQVETNVGHSLSQTPSLVINEWADIFAFISKTLDLEFSYASAHHLSVHSGVIMSAVSLSSYLIFYFGAYDQ